MFEARPDLIPELGMTVFPIRVDGSLVVLEKEVEADTLFVRPKQNPAPGDLLIALVNRNAVMVRAYPARTTTRLVPIGEKMGGPMVVQNEALAQPTAPGGIHLGEIVHVEWKQ